ncbi:MAG: flippase-like domain-containing protein [Bacteroidales bacterium]|nr:flippase-like domain-containing protein [Melioribacteraceae bacterium]MCF8398615.1 flippase-like domain-containing protein [Bacteroidales bacterium]
MKIGWFKIFFYASLLFLAVALYRNDYLKIPVIHNWFFVIVSFILLFLGFILNGISWSCVLRKRCYPIKIKIGLISVGLSVFGKYIPGKLWVILGRAEFISKECGYNRKPISALSFNAQFISIWTGLLLGTFGLILNNKIEVYGIVSLILFILLSIIIFTSAFHKLFTEFTLILLKKKIEIPKLSFINVIYVLPYFLLNWGIWIVSFYFLGESLTPNSVSFNISFGFALAGSLGILAIIAPGGLGVREGILIGYLTMTGLDLVDATTISLTSRLWFLIGEVFVFLLAIILRRKWNTNKCLKQKNK